SLCQRQCQVESHEMNEVSFSHFPLTLREIEATSSEWLLANQFEEIIWKWDTYSNSNRHFEDLKRAATTYMYQKRHRYVNLRDWHSMAGNTTTRKAVIKPSMPRIVGWHTAAPQNHAEIIMYENLPFVYGCYTSPKVALEYIGVFQELLAVFADMCHRTPEFSLQREEI
ncbi:unnamed protein product, partial [Porites evermanni]